MRLRPLAIVDGRLALRDFVPTQVAHKTHEIRRCIFSERASTEKLSARAKIDTSKRFRCTGATQRTGRAHAKPPYDTLGMKCVLAFKSTRRCVRRLRANRAHAGLTVVCHFLRRTPVDEMNLIDFEEPHYRVGFHPILAHVPTSDNVNVVKNVCRWTKCRAPSTMSSVTAFARPSRISTKSISASATSLPRQRPMFCTLNARTL